MTTTEGSSAEAVMGASAGGEAEVASGSERPERSERSERPTSRQLTVVSPKINLRQRVTAIWRYRELLVGMTRKELRVQYKDSALGFLWSMLNPAITMMVYFVVFQLILKNGIPRFAIYLMCGVLVWNFFSSAVSGACGSIVANGNIIKKVAFPREIPVLAQLGSAFVQLGFQSIVMVGFLLAFRRGPALAYVPLLVPAVIALLLLAAALGVLFAAINVRMRDMQHLLAVALQVWFWATPIVYQYRLVRDPVVFHHSHLKDVFFLWRLNPVTPIVMTFQRAIYGVAAPRGAGGVRIAILPDHAGQWWYLWQLLAVIGFSLVLLVGALMAFGKLEGNFAEEL
ncbi:MAG: ABC transporter permease [Acidimicrobiales bacterium]